MRYLEKTLKSGVAGWFNPETFHIYVSGEGGAELNTWQKQVLSHELMHYLHFTSTTLGIAFITQNFKEMNRICDWKYSKEMTNSKINTIHEDIIKVNRFKSRLSVPSYYFMKGPKFDKLINSNQWKVGTSVGTFFKSNGQTSDQNFLMHRFTTGNPKDENELIARISLGTKYLYEHLIKFIDLMADMGKDGLVKAYEYHYDNAYYGPLLPYSALALLCARFDVKGLDAFILSAIISHLSLMVPLNWTKKTMGLKKYIEEYIRKETGKPNYSFKSSYPSVVVEGFLQKALELGAAQQNFMEFFNPNNNYEKLNNYMEQLCNEFGFSLQDLFVFYEEELKKLDRTKLHVKLTPIKNRIIDEINTNLTIKRESFGKYIMNPHKPKYRPFIQMDNFVIEGDLTSPDERKLLKYLNEQRDEMLRFGFERNIIE
jgi:hypothetical protein